MRGGFLPAGASAVYLAARMARRLFMWAALLAAATSGGSSVQMELEGAVEVGDVAS
jgi:hypothetical protein